MDNFGGTCNCYVLRLPTQRIICLHRVGWWIFRRHCTRFVDAQGRCPVHGYEEDFLP
jgi:hypothetical protein